MSGHKYLPSDHNNLFDNDDDVDDDTFVNSYRPRMPPPLPKPQASAPYGGHIEELERQRQITLQRQREIEQRTVESSMRSIGLLHDSENIGIATAEELTRQRQALQNTNLRLDEINTNLNHSQKHLNGIKSVFYSLKNYISGKSDQTPPKTSSQTSQVSPDTRAGPSRYRLDDTLDNLTQSSSENHFSSHATTRLRGLEEQPVVAPDSQRVNEILDANLDEMVHAIARLKGLGNALGEEIDSQNVLIDTIQDKVEGADIRIGKQNKQMNKLLGK